MDTEVLDQDEAESTAQERVEEETVDEAALEKSVGENMRKAFASEDDAKEPDDSQSDSEEDAESGDEETPEAKDEVPEDEGTDEEQSETEEEAADPETAPTLPESYVRSLKAYGWTEEDIQKNLKLLGADFITTAAKIHGNRNTEVSSWAAAGRAARERVSPVAEGVRQTSNPIQTILQGLKPIDTAQLKEKYGEDDLIDAVVGPVNATVAALNAVLPQLMQGQQAVQNAEMQTLNRQIDEFFGGDGMKPFTSLYGDGKSELTQEQLDHRNKVLETADALVFGAKAQGRNLTTQEALTASHDLVSSEFKTEAVRAGIRKEAKARSQALVQKPNSRGKRPVGGSPRTMKELEGKVGRKLAEVFGG